MKRCFKCARELPLDAFYAHPRMADGHLGKCKDCTRADVRARYRATVDQRKTYERERNRRPGRRAWKREAERRHRERNPVKAAARNAVSNAVRDGRLERRPCEVCGQRAEAHHGDYARPLDIRWLCRRHHRDEHGRSAAA